MEHFKLMSIKKKTVAWLLILSFIMLSLFALVYMMDVIFYGGLSDAFIRLSHQKHQIDFKISQIIFKNTKNPSELKQFLRKHGQPVVDMQSYTYWNEDNQQLDFGIDFYDTGCQHAYIFSNQLDKESLIRYLCPSCHPDILKDFLTELNQVIYHSSVSEKIKKWMNQRNKYHTKSLKCREKCIRYYECTSFLDLFRQIISKGKQAWH